MSRPRCVSLSGDVAPQLLCVQAREDRPGTRPATARASASSRTSSPSSVVFAWSPRSFRPRRTTTQASRSSPATKRDAPRRRPCLSAKPAHARARGRGEDRLAERAVDRLADRHRQRRLAERDQRLAGGLDAERDVAGEQALVRRVDVGAREREAGQDRGDAAVGERRHERDRAPGAQQQRPAAEDALEGVLGEAHGGGVRRDQPGRGRASAARRRARRRRARPRGGGARTRRRSPRRPARARAGWRRSPRRSPGARSSAGRPRRPGARSRRPPGPRTCAR